MGRTMIRARGAVATFPIDSPTTSPFSSCVGDGQSEYGNAKKRLRRLWPLIWHSHMPSRCCFLRATWNQTFMSGLVPASAMSQPAVVLFRRIYAVCRKRSHYRSAQSLRKSALRQATLKGRRSVNGPGGAAIHRLNERPVLTTRQGVGIDGFSGETGPSRNRVPETTSTRL